jgi:cytochrome d ubiquinol oxidase subunit I
VLPTFLGVSRTSAGNLWLSLSGFVVFYSALAVVDAYLLTHTIRRGPDGLGYWPAAAGAPSPHGKEGIDP